MKINSYSIIKKLFVSALCGVFFTVNCVMAHSTEANFWASRRMASQRMRGEGESAIGSSGQTLLAQLPQAGPLDLGGHSAPSSPKATDLKTEPFTLGPKTGDWLGKLVMPYGTVNDVYLSPKKDAPFIVHIQDAHGIEEAQRNISSMIGLLGQEPGIHMVGVEGAWGSFSLEPYRDFPDPAMTKDLAEFLLKKGLIAGPEYAGLTLPKSPNYYGVENHDLYNANVQALKTAYKEKEAAIAWVDALKYQAEKLKETNYSETLKTFDKNFSGYQSEKVKLADYVRYLTATLKQMSPRPATPNLNLLAEALNQEETLDFKRVEVERKMMVEKLVGRLTNAQVQELVDKSVDYRAGRMGYADYHAHLKQVCQAHGISMGAYPQMGLYISYVLTADKIDRHGLLNELDTVERTLPDSLAKTAKEKELVGISYELSLLHKLVRHEMSPSDWTHYQARGETIHAIPQRLAKLGGNPVNNFDVASFEDFCRYAARRNTAIAGNLTHQMEETKTNSSVLITGGFHTEGLTSLLREKQISYVVITPKITDIPKDNNYLDVLARDPVPLEQLLAGDRIYLAKAVALADRSTVAAEIAGGAASAIKGGQVVLDGEVYSTTEEPTNKARVILTLKIGDVKVYFVRAKKLLSSFKSLLTLLNNITGRVGKTFSQWNKKIFQNQPTKNQPTGIDVSHFRVAEAPEEQTPPPQIPDNANHFGEGEAFNINLKNLPVGTILHYYFGNFHWEYTIRIEENNEISIWLGQEKGRAVGPIESVGSFFFKPNVENLKKSILEYQTGILRSDRGFTMPYFHQSKFGVGPRHLESVGEHRDDSFVAIPHGLTIALPEGASDLKAYLNSPSNKVSSPPAATIKGLMPVYRLMGKLFNSNWDNLSESERVGLIVERYAPLVETLLFGFIYGGTIALLAYFGIDLSSMESVGLWGAYNGVFALSHRSFYVFENGEWKEKTIGEVGPAGHLKVLLASLVFHFPLLGLPVFPASVFSVPFFASIFNFSIIGSIFHLAYTNWAAQSRGLTTISSNQISWLSKLFVAPTNVLKGLMGNDSTRIENVGIVLGLFLFPAIGVFSPGLFVGTIFVLLHLKNIARDFKIAGIIPQDATENFRLAIAVGFKRAPAKTVVYLTALVASGIVLTLVGSFVINLDLSFISRVFPTDHSIMNFILALPSVVASHTLYQITLGGKQRGLFYLPNWTIHSNELPRSVRRDISDVIEAYRMGRIDALEKQNHLPEWLIGSNIQTILRSAAESIVRENIKKTTFHWDRTKYGTEMKVLVSGKSPNVIVKTSKFYDEENLSGTEHQAEEHFSTVIRPGYNLAIERLGGLFTATVLQNVSVTLESGENIFLRYAIVQEKKRTIGEYRASFLARRDVIGNAKIVKLQDELNAEIDEVWETMVRRGVVDMDENHDNNGYMDGSVGFFDADKFIPVDGIRAYYEKLFNGNIPESWVKKIDDFIAHIEKVRREKGTLEPVRVPEVFADDYADLQRAILEEMYRSWARENNLKNPAMVATIPAVAKIIRVAMGSLVRIFPQWGVGQKWARLTGQQQLGKTIRSYAPFVETVVKGVTFWALHYVLMAMGVDLNFSTDVGILALVNLAFGLLHTKVYQRDPSTGELKLSKTTSFATRLSIAVKGVAMDAPLLFSVFSSLLGPLSLILGNAAALVGAIMLHRVNNAIAVESSNARFGAIWNAVTTAVVSTTFAVIVAPFVMANFATPLSAFFFISLVTQILDPSTLHAFSQNPTSAITTLIFGTVTNFSTFVFSLGAPAMIAVGVVGGLFAGGVSGKMPALVARAKKFLGISLVATALGMVSVQAAPEVTPGQPTVANQVQADQHESRENIETIARILLALQDYLKNAKMEGVNKYLVDNGFYADRVRDGGTIRAYIPGQFHVVFDHSVASQFNGSYRDEAENVSLKDGKVIIQLMDRVITVVWERKSGAYIIRSVFQEKRGGRAGRRGKELDGTEAIAQAANKAVLMSVVEQLPRAGSVLSRFLRNQIEVEPYWKPYELMKNSGVGDQEIQEAIKIAERPQTQEKAIEHFEQILDEVMIGNSRLTVGFFSNANKEDSDRRLDLVWRTLEANKPLLLLSDNPQIVNDLAIKLNLSRKQKALIRVMEANYGISMDEVAKTYDPSDDIPLAPIVYASEGAVKGNDRFIVLSFEGVSVLIQNAIDRLILVLNAA